MKISNIPRGVFESGCIKDLVNTKSNDEPSLVFDDVEERRLILDLPPETSEVRIDWKVPSRPVVSYKYGRKLKLTKQQWTA